MPKKKTTEGNMTLAFDSEEDVIVEQTSKQEPLTMGQEQTLALGRLDKKEKETSPTFDEQKLPPPLVRIDTSFQEAYLKDKGLTAKYQGSGNVTVCYLIDPTTNLPIVGIDPETYKPQAFGLTQERALVNAVEFHKRMVPGLKVEHVHPLDKEEPTSKLQTKEIDEAYEAYQKGELTNPYDERWNNLKNPPEALKHNLTREQIPGVILDALKCLIKDEIALQLKQTDSGLRNKLAKLLEE